MRRTRIVNMLLLLVFSTLPFSITPVEAQQVALDSDIQLSEAWITLPDGVRLAADIYRSESAPTESRMPVLLEYTPYRKTDSRARNLSLYSYFVRNGYVVVRVDIRGTGNSEGATIPYEYSDIELDDGEIVIDWLSKQAWSSGNVGMFGISWGGFNGIQMALRQPPALKTFISLMATEKLYQEDVHYMDGIIHTDSWMMSNDLYNALPGAPDFVLDEEWERNRFSAEPSVYTYMRQQRDGPFWDRSSARDRYEDIQIPSFHIGGWYDGYRNSIPRMLENVKAPVKAMIGPWDHYFPNTAWPKPQMEWRHEAVRWFDQWLKGIDTGILDEPRFAVYIRDYHPPNPSLEEVSGSWRWEDGWPIKRTQNQIWYADNEHRLARTPSSKTATHTMKYIPSAGLQGGGPTMWWGSITPDQQPMDDHSLVYDSEPLEESLEILGRAQALINVSATAPRANWVVRLSDIAPDGQVTQVAGIGFNGTHRLSARKPIAVVPGEYFPLKMDLMLTSWVFPKGHKIRLAISNSQWPMLWPTPMPMSSALAIGGIGGAQVQLPVILAAPARVPIFKAPATDPQMPEFETLDAGNLSGYAAITSIELDPKTNEAFGVARNSGGTRYPWGEERFEEAIEHRTSDKNPAYTSVEGSYTLDYQLEDRRLRFEQEVEFTSDRENFRLTFHRRVFVNDEIFRQKSWDEIIPRDFQ